MDNTDRIRLIVFSSILFFILTLPFMTNVIIKMFELIFGFKNLNTFKLNESNDYTIFGRIVISIIYAIILILLL